MRCLRFHFCGLLKSKINISTTFWHWVFELISNTIIIMSPKPNFLYFKTILSKVYGYPTVFNKELKKAKTHLSSYDYNRLKAWLSKLETTTLPSD